MNVWYKYVWGDAVKSSLSFKCNHSLGCFSSCYAKKLLLSYEFLCSAYFWDFQLLFTQGQVRSCKGWLVSEWQSRSALMRSASIMFARLQFMYVMWSAGKKDQYNHLDDSHLTRKMKEAKKWFHSNFLIAFLGLVPLLFPVAVPRPYVGVL